jgi:thiamine thiazole synthase
MTKFDETQISRLIASAYHEKLTDRLVSDVLIAGAGPAGLVAGANLAARGFKVTLVEMRLSTGGGIWGGGMGMNEVVIQKEAVHILDDAGIRRRDAEDGLYTVDSVELSAGLCLKAIQSGVVILNLTTVEDVCVHGSRVTGVVVNRTGISGKLHVDPIMFSARCVIDGTGHDAAVVEHVRRHGLLRDSKLIDPVGEGPMDVESGEAFVVERAGEAYPGLWVTGMSVSAAFGGPRMGPIFGGMLLSGERVAKMVADDLTKRG